MRFWRREPLHERLAREGALGPEQPVADDARPRWGETGIHGLHRVREWDVVATAEAPDVPGDAVAFVALPDGSLLVEDGDAEAELDPLARAVESELSAPYRAQAARQTEELWTVSARRIQVVQLEWPGESLELTSHGDERTLLVDGERAFGSVPALERLGEREGPNYAVVADRLDGDLWEVRVSAL
ncbi:MAG TPA: hypothetical protein VGF23_12775 [Gaiellaceae bacterium]|jgi:hypothetical protein